MSVPIGNEPSHLCCCEYVNRKGERSHLLACLCDCEDIDLAFDNCINCNKVQSNTMRNISATIADRCRIPWCGGRGAIQVRLDVIFPIIMVPSCILLGSIGPVMTIVALVSMPFLMFLFYRIWRRHHTQVRTKFFSSWANTSIIFSYFVFQTFVVAFRKILLWEFLLFFTALLALFYVLYLTKKNPGFLKFGHADQETLTVEDPQSWRPNSKWIESLKNSDKNWNDVYLNGDAKIQIDANGENHSISSSQYNMTNNCVNESMAPMIPMELVTWVDSRPIEGHYLITWCGFCNLQRPPRTGHCYVCNSCIGVRDHHCVWIDNCIGANNHRPFLVSMILFIFCGIYGSHLTLTTVCTPEIYYNWILWPNDCRFLYSDFQTSISFVTACYVIASTSIILLAFVQQILFISQNVTSQELHRATMNGKSCIGLYAYNNVHNRGLRKNWMEFIFKPSRSISPKIPV